MFWAAKKLIHMTGKTFRSVSFFELVFICILYLKIKIDLQYLITLQSTRLLIPSWKNVEVRFYLFLPGTKTENGC